MTVTKYKKWRSNFLDKSGRRFWWTMIEIYILGDHKWFPIIRKNFLAWLQKFKFLFLKNFPRPVITTVMIMTDHLENFLRPITTIVMIMTDRHHHSHDHDTVTDLLRFWVIATALFTFITPPMAIFFYVGINRSHLSAGEVRGSWENILRAIFEDLILNSSFNHPSFQSLFFVIFSCNILYFNIRVNW